MKTLNALLIATTLAASTSLLRADGLSPRAESNRTRTVNGSSADLARSTPSGSPRGEANKVRVVANSKDDGDTLAGIRSSRLSPRAQQQLGESDFQVAAAASKSECCPDCCKK